MTLEKSVKNEEKRARRAWYPLAPILNITVIPDMDIKDSPDMESPFVVYCLLLEYAGND